MIHEFALIKEWYIIKILDGEYLNRKYKQNWLLSRYLIYWVKHEPLIHIQTKIIFNNFYFLYLKNIYKIPNNICIQFSLHSNSLSLSNYIILCTTFYIFFLGIHLPIFSPKIK